MTLGQRIEARASALGISQSELARRIGVGPTTINGLIRGNARWTPYLFKIAKHLQTSAEYLVGETDDPDQGAPPPPVEPHTQLLMMPVSFPSEEALAAMYSAQLRAFARLQGDDLARALAKRLPKALARLQGQHLTYEWADDDVASEAPEPHPISHSEPRRARRK